MMTVTHLVLSGTDRHMGLMGDMAAVVAGIMGRMEDTVAAAVVGIMGQMEDTEAVEQPLAGIMAPGTDMVAVGHGKGSIVVISQDQPKSFHPVGFCLIISALCMIEKGIGTLTVKGHMVKAGAMAEAMALLIGNICHVRM